MDDHSQRLHKLRENLHNRGLDGFLIPRSDAHQGESVPPCCERLHWISGFSGSAGQAIVLAQAAALFVDGRYSLQARAEVSEELFDICSLSDWPQWLARHVGAGLRLAYDPWLHTERQIAGLLEDKTNCGEKVELVPLSRNPIDALWDDRPAPPCPPAWSHDLRFAGESTQDKIARMAQAVADKGADAVVLTLPESINWLLNVRGGDVARTPLVLSFAILTASGRVDWFVDAPKITAAVQLPDGVVVRDPDAFEDSLSALAGQRVLLDPVTAPVRLFQLLDSVQAQIVRAPDPCLLAKACKNDVELSGSRAAHRRDGVAMVSFLKWLEDTALPRARAGNPLTEADIAQRLLQFRQGGDYFSDLSFDTICAAGPHGAICHYRVTAQSNRPVGEGDVLLIDSGAQYRDGTTDLTRTVMIGPPTSPQAQEVATRFTAVLKGMIALSRVSFPAGTTGTHLDVLARRPLWAQGVDFDHGTGHGVGSFLGVHEGPQRISRAWNATALKPGMILSNEPGYYKAGAYGIRIENLVAVQPHPTAESFFSFETLTLCPIETALMKTELLDDTERSWLNDYHANLRDCLCPDLAPDVREWLIKKTAPL